MAGVASKRAERPEGRRLLETAGKGDVIITAKLDRAFRNAADALATPARTSCPQRLTAREVESVRSKDAIPDRRTSDSLKCVSKVVCQSSFPSKFLSSERIES